MGQNDIVKKDNNNNEGKSLMQIQQKYVGAIGVGLNNIIGTMTNYQALCGYNMLNSISVLLAKEGKNFKSPGVDGESVNNAIKYAIVYQLNVENKEVFVILRNEKRKGPDGKEYWVKVVEYKPQYKGTLKILSTYGKDVAHVYPEWLVREGDEFTYPMFKGIEVVPPTWVRKDPDGKIVRVLVPIQYKNGFIDYRIAERESVATNLKAQIKQTLNSKPDKVREEIMAKIQDRTLDQMLEDKTIADYVNDTYTGISKEEMLITKMVVNAVKRVQIDYQSALARELNEKTFDNADVYKQNHNAEELLAAANAPMIQDVEEIEAKENPKLEDQPTLENKPTPEVDEDGVVHRREPSDDGINLFEFAKENEGEE